MCHLSWLVFCCVPAASQTTPPLLKKGAVTSGRITPGESKAFRVDARAGNYFEVNVAQRGVDLQVRLIDPSGAVLLELDGPQQAEGTEAIAYIAGADGAYRIEIAAAGAKAEPGEYAVALLQIEAATAKDRSRAVNLLCSAGQAYEDQNQTSKALRIYNQALALERRAGDRDGEGVVLTAIGGAYLGAESYDEAIATLEQALAISRELKDRQREGSNLCDLGTALRGGGQFEKALGYFEQALAIFQQTREANDQATALNGLAQTYVALKRYAEAIRDFESALALYHDAKDRPAEAATLDNIGDAYKHEDDHDGAIKAFSQEMQIRHELHDKEGEASSATALGNQYFDLSQYREAAKPYQQAAAIWHELKERSDEVDDLNRLGNAQMHFADAQTALSNFEQALTISHEIKDRENEGVSFNNVGWAYLFLMQDEKARQNLEQAEAIQRETKGSPESGTLDNLGTVYIIREQPDRALEYLYEALVIERKEKDRNGQAITLNRVANLNVNLGHYADAIAALQEAVSLQRQIEPEVYAVTLNNLSMAYYKLGQYPKALRYCQEADALGAKLKDWTVREATIANLGQLYAAVGQYEKAAAQYEEAMKVQVEMHDRLSEGLTLANLGVLRSDVGKHDKAVALLQQALDIAHELADRRLEAAVLLSLGIMHRRLDHYELARQFSEQALPMLHELREREEEAAALDNLMRTWQDLQRPALSVFYGKQAIALLQSVRGEMGDLSKDLQQSYIGQKKDTYRDLADLLISLGRLPEAEQVLDLLKTDEYFQFVRRGQNLASGLEGRAPLTKTEAPWAARYQEISDTLAKLGAEYDKLYALKANRTPEQDAQFAKLSKDMDISRSAFADFLTGLNSQFGTKMLSRESETKEQLLNTRALQDTLSHLGNAVAVYTLVGEDKYRAILVTPTVQRAYEYPIKAADLDKKIAAFREALKSPLSDPRPLAEELYHILIVPALAEDLRQSGAATIMWSLDQTLRYLPLAALYDGKQYLVEKYSVAVFTPASNPRLLEEPAAAKSVLGLGVTKRYAPFEPLSGVARELNGIVKDNSGRSGVVPGQVLLDEAFTADALRDGLTRGYPWVHLATHFVFQSGDDTDSFLLLGDGQHLSLADLGNVQFRDVDLLTLSACNTGVGGSGNGSEVEGFGVMAQQQGARGVIASLWSVDDQSTSLFMQDFYRRLASAPAVSKVEALRQAQLGLLNGTTKPAAGPADARGVSVEAASPAKPALPGFSHPYYWAPFFLMGNWR